MAFHALSSDMMMSIINTCTVEDQRNLSCVCRGIRKLVTRDYLWIQGLHHSLQTSFANEWSVMVPPPGVSFSRMVFSNICKNVIKGNHSVILLPPATPVAQPQSVATVHFSGDDILCGFSDGSVRTWCVGNNGSSSLQWEFTCYSEEAKRQIAYWDRVNDVSVKMSVLNDENPFQHVIEQAPDPAAEFGAIGEDMGFSFWDDGATVTPVKRADETPSPDAGEPKVQIDWLNSEDSGSDQSMSGTVHPTPNDPVQRKLGSACGRTKPTRSEKKKEKKAKREASKGRKKRMNECQKQEKIKESTSTDSCTLPTIIASPEEGSRRFVVVTDDHAVVLVDEIEGMTPTSVSMLSSSPTAPSELFDLSCKRHEVISVLSSASSQGKSREKVGVQFCALPAESGGTPCIITMKSNRIIVHTSDGDLLWNLDYDEEAILTAVAAKSDASYASSSGFFATGDSNGNVFVWSVLSGERVKKIRSGSKNASGIKFLEVKHDRMCAVTETDSIFLWDWSCGELLACIEKPHISPLMTLTVAPGDCNYLVSGHKDGVMRVHWYDHFGGPTPRKPVKLCGHSRAVRKIVVESTMIISCADDGMVKFWEVLEPNFGRCMKSIRVHSSPIISLAVKTFAVVCGSIDGSTACIYFGRKGRSMAMNLKPTSPKLQRNNSNGSSARKSQSRKAGIRDNEGQVRRGGREKDKNWKCATANSSNRRSLRDLGAKLKSYDDFIFDMEDY